MANQSTVASVNEVADSTAIHSSTIPGSPDITKLQVATPSTGNRLMACFVSGKHMKQNEFQNQLVTYSCNLPCRPGTKKQYKVYIKKWIDFCSEREICHTCPTVGQTLDFLKSLYEQGLTYSAINTARSALSSYINFEDGTNLGKQPLASRLLKGILQGKPPTPIYSKAFGMLTFY
jgi:hypothetical protein